jgi:hypothetical protein
MIGAVRGLDGARAVRSADGRWVLYLEPVHTPRQQSDGWRLVEAPGTPVVLLTTTGWQPGRLTAWCRDPDRPGWLARIRTRGLGWGDAIGWYRADPRWLLPIELDALDARVWLSPARSTGPYDKDQPENDPYLTGRES